MPSREEEHGGYEADYEADELTFYEDEMSLTRKGRDCETKLLPLETVSSLPIFSNIVCYLSQ